GGRGAGDEVKEAAWTGVAIRRPLRATGVPRRAEPARPTAKTLTTRRLRFSHGWRARTRRRAVAKTRGGDRQRTGRRHVLTHWAGCAAAAPSGLPALRHEDRPDGPVVARPAVVRHDAHGLGPEAPREHVVERQIRDL